MKVPFEENQFLKNQYGQIKSNSLKNIRIAIENDDILKNKFIFNEFSQELEIKEDFKLNKTDFKKGNFREVYKTAVLEYFEDKYKVLFVDKNLMSVIASIAEENRYNPVKDFMERCYCEWDGRKRAGTLLPDFLGVEENESTEQKTKIFFVGAVMKVYKPFEKFDFVLDLVGGQGAGKTTFLTKMGREWYTDNIASFDNKDDLPVMLRALIVNDDEMSVSEKTRFSDLKKFVTQTSLTFRPPYASKSERHAKNFVIARTTNHDEYQKDRTGARRWLPVKCSTERQKHHPVTDLTDEIVRQVWGEMVYYYKQGFNFTLSAEFEEILDKERGDFEYFDEQEELLEQYLEIPIPEDFYKGFDNNSGKWARRYYISGFIDTGNPPDHIFKGEIKTRDFVTASYFHWEAMGVEVGKGSSKITAKFKNVMSNKKDWQKASRRGKRGFKRIL
ncbi:hypothetical protein BM86_11785 [Bacillus thuringiensis]|nr:hypothetical protein [Bacillus thuringiensis]